MCCDWSEADRADEKRDEDPDTASERAPAKSSPTDLILVPKPTLEKYRRECAGVMSVESSGAMTAGGQSLVMYGQNRFEHDLALGVWKQC